MRFAKKRSVAEPDHVYILKCDEAEEEEERRVTAAERALVEHYRQIQTKQEENEFLGVVVADYNRYLAHIRGEKQRQYDAMRGLLEYIERLTGETDHDLRETAHDQEDLIREMVRVKREIDECGFK